MRWAADYLKTNYKVDKFPIGAVKTARGITTLTGGWVDEYGQTVTDANKNKYTKRMMVFQKRGDNLYPLPPDDDEDKVYTILCCR